MNRAAIERHLSDEARACYRGRWFVHDWMLTNRVGTQLGTYYLRFACPNCQLWTEFHGADAATLERLGVEVPEATS